MPHYVGGERKAVFLQFQCGQLVAINIFEVAWPAEQTTRRFLTVSGEFLRVAVMQYTGQRVHFE